MNKLPRPKAHDAQNIWYPPLPGASRHGPPFRVRGPSGPIRQKTPWSGSLGTEFKPWPSGFRKASSQHHDCKPLSRAIIVLSSIWTRLCTGTGISLCCRALRASISVCASYKEPLQRASTVHIRVSRATVHASLGKRNPLR